MSSESAYAAGAIAILYAHFGIVAFNIFWLIAIPLGACRDWRFVRNIWWRSAHMASLAVVALQALDGRLCFLTILQDDFETRAGAALQAPSLLTRLVTNAIYWPLQLSTFVVIYCVGAAFAVASWWLVPPRVTSPTWRRR